MSINREVIVYNVDTEEWIVTFNKVDYWTKIKYLLSKNDKICEKPNWEGAILKGDLGQSRWKRQDKIVLVNIENLSYFEKTKLKIHYEGQNDQMYNTIKRYSKFHDELISATWHPSRFQDWCYDEDDKKMIDEMFY